MEDCTTPDGREQTGNIYHNYAPLPLAGEKLAPHQPAARFNLGVCLRGKVLTMVCRIPLSKSGLFAMVDQEDYERVSLHKWRPSPAGRSIYAQTQISGKTVLLHRLVMGASRGEVVDHINSDGFDNRKTNLRFCSTSQNGQNSRKQICETSSRYKGVCKYQPAGRDIKWQAQIMFGGKLIYLGQHVIEEDAARAYNSAAVKMFGEFALLNEFANDVQSYPQSGLTPA